MLKSVRVEGFRSLRYAELERAQGGLTVLIGPNGGGKSNVLELLDLLAGCALEGTRAAFHRREGIDSCMAGRDPIRILARLDPKGVLEPDGPGPIEYEAVISEQHGQPRVDLEDLRLYKRGTEQRPLTVLHTGPEGRWALNVRSRAIDPLPDDGTVGEGSRDAADTTPRQELLLSALRQPDIYPTVAHVQAALGSIRVYAQLGALPHWLNAAQTQLSPRHEQMAEPVARLDSRGMDLTNALKTIHDDHENDWRELLRDLGAELPYVSQITFPSLGGGAGRITLRYFDERLGRKLTIAEMPDGMLHYLQLLAALHGRDAAAALGFDEPDQSLHPSLVRRLVARMEVCAADTPIFVATHSDALLDCLETPEDAVRIVECDADTGTRIERVDAAALRAWRNDYTMSQLRRQRMLDRAPG